jgi:hypothetical protein
MTVAVTTATNYDIAMNNPMGIGFCQTAAYYKLAPKPWFIFHDTYSWMLVIPQCITKQAWTNMGIN